MKRVLLIILVCPILMVLAMYMMAGILYGYIEANG